MHKRPEMYIGPTKSQKVSNSWVVESGKFMKKDIIFSPGLERLFIEAISNAIDNKQRSEKSNTPCTKIKIAINTLTGEISVWNDGMSIPVEKKVEKGEEIYIHSLIFGKLLSGENYDDTKQRYSSGRNGVGIKLVNTFSTEFKIKASDGTKNFSQKWTNHMRSVSKPRACTLKKCKKVGFTQVSWTPDFSLFQCLGYSDDLLKILHKHAYDCAMITGIPVYLDKKKIPVKSLKDYAKLYLEAPTREILELQSLTCKVVVTPNNSTVFEHVAFTNGICNKDGGVHVDAWKETIFRPLVNKINKPNKPHITITDLLSHFRIFISSTIPNPEFSSQSKTKLTAPGVVTNITKAQLVKLYKWKFMDAINDLIKGKELVKLKKVSKKSRKFKKIQGFDPANNAGGKASRECSLILCEGLSAKTYAVQGIQVGWNGKQGRDWFGIYPLRGKLMNVRNSNLCQITKNKELNDVIHALGVQFGVDYTIETNFKTLNYGRVIILCDSDVDGIHIAGLIMNFFHQLFPSLLQREKPFIISMKTPIVKVFLKGTERIFYTQLEFKKFAKSHSSFKTKYYKGLGTSSEKEVLATFGKKVQSYIHDDFTDDCMNKIFSSKCSDQRKKWLTGFNPDVIPSNSDKITFSHFLDTQLILFSIDDCARSIPNLFDGFKESHRKILYSVFKKNLTFRGHSMKVAQLAGYVAEQTNYHHGEQCLSCMTKMANDFPGSKNIPLLFPDGQFGSRLHGAKDAANARYIFTKLGEYTRLLFPKVDDELLTRVVDDGDAVEPEYYLPILPMILCNGCTAGIGTGWSCSVPQYNPLDLGEEIRKWLKGEEFSELIPWYNGFKGEIHKISTFKYETTGTFHKEGKDVIIDELPINVWTDKYKEFLEGLLEGKKLKSVKNYSTPTIVKFVIRPMKDFECTIDSLKLKSYLHNSNMVLFTEPHVLKKFKTIHTILTTYCEKRLALYHTRKKVLVKNLATQLKYITNEKRFIKNIMGKKLVIHGRREDDIIKKLSTQKFDRKNGSFDYLLDMPLRRFTKTKIKELVSRAEKFRKELHTIEGREPKKMWLDELKEFIAIYKVKIKKFL